MLYEQRLKGLSQGGLLCKLFSRPSELLSPAPSGISYFPYLFVAKRRSRVHLNTKKEKERERKKHDIKQAKRTSKQREQTSESTRTTNKSPSLKKT